MDVSFRKRDGRTISAFDDALAFCTANLNLSADSAGYTARKSKAKGLPVQFAFFANDAATHDPTCPCIRAREARSEYNPINVNINDKLREVLHFANVSARRRYNGSVLDMFFDSVYIRCYKPADKLLSTMDGDGSGGSNVHAPVYILFVGALRSIYAKHHNRTEQLGNPDVFLDEPVDNKGVEWAFFQSDTKGARHARTEEILYQLTFRKLCTCPINMAHIRSEESSTTTTDTSSSEDSDIESPPVEEIKNPSFAVFNKLQTSATREDALDVLTTLVESTDNVWFRRYEMSEYPEEMLGYDATVYYTAMTLNSAVYSWCIALKQKECKRINESWSLVVNSILRGVIVPRPLPVEGDIAYALSYPTGVDEELHSDGAEARLKALITDMSALEERDRNRRANLVDIKLHVEALLQNIDAYAQWVVGHLLFNGFQSRVWLEQEEQERKPMTRVDFASKSLTLPLSVTPQVLWIPTAKEYAGDQPGYAEQVRFEANMLNIAVLAWLQTIPERNGAAYINAQWAIEVSRFLRCKVVQLDVGFALTDDTFDQEPRDVEVKVYFENLYEKMTAHSNKSDMSYIRRQAEIFMEAYVSRLYQLSSALVGHEDQVSVLHEGPPAPEARNKPDGDSLNTNPHVHPTTEAVTTDPAEPSSLATNHRTSIVAAAGAASVDKTVVDERDVEGIRGVTFSAQRKDCWSAHNPATILLSNTGDPAPV